MTGPAALCRHCGSPLGGESAAVGGFCCAGCAAAYELISAQGLDLYYRRRCLDPTAQPPRPDGDGVAAALSDHVTALPGGESALSLMVDGVQCGACVWLIESLLTRQPGVTWARVNLTTRRLALRFRPEENDPAAILAPVFAVGYRLVPFDPDRLESDDLRHERGLLKAMAVTGFAAGNVMLLSVSVWAGHAQGMGPATRGLLHWVSALVALPAVVYGLRPFAASALGALRAGRTNMDVPITIGVVLTSAMSLWETVNGGPHAYFDSAVSLLFFLLIGRYLEARARGRARSAVEHLLALDARAVLVIDSDGHRRLVPPRRVMVGQTVLVAAGERVGIDGVVIDGRSDIESGLLTGESVPMAAGPGSPLYAGTMNLTAPLRLRVTAVGEDTLLAGIVRMMEVAEQGRARYVAFAERVARWYAPVVHLTALVTFIGWIVLAGMAWQPALLIAVSVLIVTCPCALALAVPVVQVIASGRLMRRGVLVKSATALERLAEIDHVVFDKTGTLTAGRPVLRPEGGWNADDLAVAASLAVASSHPLARALVAACPDVRSAEAVTEHPGQGLSGCGGDRLGSRAFVAVLESDEADGPELWLARPGETPVRFAFADRPRADANDAIAALRHLGLSVELLSGDRRVIVAALADTVGITDWRGGCDPAAKVARLTTLAARGRRVLMVGDGLNDAPALAAAHVSISPASGADISRAAADLVFQGERLAPLVEAIAVARQARTLTRQNFALALGYNLLAVPLAISGVVTPLIAAIAMSASSLLVIVNALRLSGGRR
ncbi:heavy metal translocating P-type ATPase [Magnetospirillum molischianum]|uniref:Nitrogen fixation protein fixI calcium ATPase, transmembrane domain n=1 Tax=Magnetospirillum molischianum DSM 120 TaxID=1150626 RepID=H8FX24_MAGML|nr:heavy metal translocating P-type ATPase metal-binding domain-containing protein [Magnetospirillum molischianum]CCG42912.1 nitrogen fixation protein fixI; calcium ATPase, transmembrane domain [Magnetospirillum molischianum DSM 120]